MHLSRGQAGWALAVGLALSALQAPFHGSPEVWAGCALSLALAWASAVDLDRRLLPDVVTLGLVLGGLALGLAGSQTPLLDAALGAVAGYLSLWLVAAGYRAWRGREGLGMGDAKLLAAAGAWMGWQALPFVVLAGSLSALAWVGVIAVTGRSMTRTSELAFGPFLAGGFWLAWTLDPVSRIAT